MIDAILGFLRLNGYGIYVWPAFAFAAAVLAWMALSTVRRLRLNERALAELEHIRARIRAHEATNDRAEGDKPSGGKEDAPS